MSAKEYAEKAGLNASTLTYWSWRLNSKKEPVDARADAGNAGAMVELEITPVVVSAPIEIAFPGAAVRVPPGADEATLAMVVRVLEGAR